MIEIPEKANIDSRFRNVEGINSTGISTTFEIRTEIEYITIVITNPKVIFIEGFINNQNY
jgi:hypothetical protein